MIVEVKFQCTKCNADLPNDGKCTECGEVHEKIKYKVVITSDWIKAPTFKQ